MGVAALQRGIEPFDGLAEPPANRRVPPVFLVVSHHGELICTEISEGCFHHSIKRRMEAFLEAEQSPEKQEFLFHLQRNVDVFFFFCI